MRNIGHPSLASLGLLTCLLAYSGCASRQANVEPAGLASVQGLGSLSFPNSGAPAAQKPFLRGVLLLHSFEYGRAAESFREAQEQDSVFALAFWGEAMTYNHPLWREKDTAAGREALARLAPTAEVRRERAGTEREAMYLDAVEQLYSDRPKSEQDLAYMDAMKRLSESYPDDMEARAFYALSILGSADGIRDYATYVRAAFTAQTVFDRNPNHPGGAHYIIHSFDDPVHAPLGLEAARAYSVIAPDAAHAQHMTTHIFVALGMWEDVVRGNIRAVDAQEADRERQGGRRNVCGHYSSWLHYGYLMLGKSDEAEKLMDACHARTSEEPTKGEWYYFVHMRARHIVDTEQWDLRNRWTADVPDLDVDEGDPDEARYGFFYRLTNAFAGLRDGDAAPARAFLGMYTDPLTASEEVQIEELRGLLAIEGGRIEEGIDLLASAAEAEAAIPMPFGPPSMVKPTFELLAEELARAGRGDEAKKAQRTAEARTPGRPLAERGSGI